jgi:hypothetical protein
MDDDRKADLRSRLQEMLRKVPASVNSSSVQASREFKKWYADAMKTINKPRASLHELESLFSTATIKYQ